MDRLCQPNAAPSSGAPKVTALERPKSAACCTVRAPRTPLRRVPLESAPNIPQPPFWGSRIIRDMRIDDAFAYMNTRTLFSTQSQFAKSAVAPTAYERHMREDAERARRPVRRRA